MSDYNWQEWPCEIGGSRTSRSVWEKEIGPIPDDLHVLHRCDEEWCKESHHLFLGTNADNVADKVSKGRQAKTCGNDLPQSKLGPVSVSAIRKLLLEGMRQRDIGEIFGISQSTVCQINRNVTWQSVA